MKSDSIKRLIHWLLAAMTGVVLALNLPQDSVFSQYTDLVLIYGFLTAAALYFTVLLSEGELGAGHVVGIVAILSLPESAQNTMMWAVFLGGVLGGLSMLVRKEARSLPRRRLTVQTAQSVIVKASGVTLSFFTASRLYTELGGVLPFDQLTLDEVPALVGFGLLYVLVYYAIFILEAYVDGVAIPQLLQGNWATLVTVLVFPVPFAILGAEVFDVQESSTGSIIALATGLILLIAVLYATSRAQFQLRRQVDEMRALSMVSQAMGSSLNLNSLLNMIYLHVVQLLETDTFMVVLYDNEGKHLQFPLVARRSERGEQIQEERADEELTDRRTLLNHVLQTQMPLLLERDVAARAQSMGLLPPDEPVNSWLGVPLKSGAHGLGAMVVAAKQPYWHFDRNDLRLLNIIAANASIAIDNAQLYREQTGRIDQLATMNNILTLMTGTLSPESVLDTIISSASAISGATAVAVYLIWDEEQSALALVRSAGLGEIFLLDPPDPLIKANNELEGLWQQLPLVVTDGNLDERAAGVRAVMTREGKSAWIELPLAVADSALGVLVLYFDEPRLFSGENIEMLRTFANQTAQAISNARQYARTDEALEQRIGHLLALARLSREVTATMDIASICDMVLDLALDVTHAVAGVFVLRAEDGSLRVYGEYGYPKNTFVNQVVPEQGITARALHNAEWVLIEDVDDEPDYLRLRPTTRSQVTVPLVRIDSVVGVITLESDTLQAFSQEDGEFLTQLANQTVISIDNALFFNRITEARDRLQAILDTMREALILIDNLGKVALANSHVNLLGLSVEQLLGKNVAALLEQTDIDIATLTGFDSAQDISKLMQAMRNPATWVEQAPLSYTLHRQRGEVHIYRQIIPVRDAGGSIIGMLLVFYDQTEQRELEQTREHMSQMLVHDLRGPLTAVTSSLKLMADLVPKENDLRPVVEDLTDTSRQAVRKLLRRVDSLLDISKMQSQQLTLETRPTALEALVSTILQELMPLAEHLNVELNSSVNATLPLLEIDSDKVERTLLNLTDNALKFSPGNSNVTIQAQTLPSENGESDFVRVAVVDQGPGVPDDYKVRLFDRFVQIKGRRGARRGTGLGLTFCRLAIEAHGGRIWIEDNPDGGSIFAFTLPVAQIDQLSPNPEKETPAN